jgi:V/A-type H+-transporting ATPase subunit I
MIVEMHKVYVAARSSQRDELLHAVRELGAIHLDPVDASHAVADATLLRRVEGMARAAQVLASVEPAGSAPALTAEEAADEVLAIQRRATENRTRLTALFNQIEQLAPWGDLQRAKVERLRSDGVDVQFYSVDEDQVGAIEAECAQVVGSLSGGRSLVAVIDRRGPARMPDDAVGVPLPPRDAPSIRAEAAEIDASLKRDVERLRELAHLKNSLREESHRLEQQADYQAALRGASADESLFALRGWIPAEKGAALADELHRAGIAAAVQVSKPADDELPPTLTRPPRWARPIEGLFGMLGTVPGYREFDVSVPFLVALPIFTAMLVGDGGYGLLLLLTPLIFYRKMTSVLGASFTHLILILGAATTVWGLLCASFFGFILYTPLIPVDMTAYSRTLLMRTSFIIGALHLSVAQLWPAVVLFPDLRFLARVGWAVFIWGMLGVVQMFVLNDAFGWHTPWPYLLIVGASLAIGFHAPMPNVAKAIALGFANFPLAMLSAFSDVISYVRLMAVGLASSVLATSFNDMAKGMDAWPLMVLVLVFGHSLNLGLALIAIFAHGVRLNMLEFSNNLGMQWTGYPYRPFLKRPAQE